MTAASSTASSPAPSMFAVFHKRDFSLLWTAQLVSTIGSSLTDLAAGILVYRVTGSALSVGLMLMATAVPSLVVGLLAGVVRRIATTLVILHLCSATLLAGTTGKIAGRITDGQTHDGLPGTTILLEGTHLGAAADVDGYYFITC